MKSPAPLKKAAIIILLFSLFVFLHNSSLFAGQRQGQPYLLAHRGLAQTFSMEDITRDTCTAERIFEPEHPYLENTIPSMEAAFAAGADIVEFDIRPTKDERFAVFHDWTLDCRTEATGEPRAYTMAELRRLDIGYGYTTDGGETFPFRGQGIGLMPSLDEVLAHFPDRQFLIHIKSNDPEEGIQLARALEQLPAQQQRLLTVYGGDAPIQALHENLPDIRVMSVETMKQCLLTYIAIGWTGYVPPACQKSQLHLPEIFAPWLWGWPNKFMDRMDVVDTRVIVVAGNGGWSEGFDQVEDLQRLPTDYTGGIWTNRIDKIAPVFHNQLPAP